MTLARIVVDDDCNNAPKRALLRDLLIAWVHGDWETMRPLLAEDIAWEFVGEPTVRGREALMERAAEGDPAEMTDVVIARILSHGKLGAIEGTIALRNGMQLGFCHVVTFSGHAKTAPVMQMRSFVVPAAR